ncbi:MAG: DNA recombination protein RmuC [Chloroflexota bacterium]|nr:DNA recombination protein RmuC [Chloroflexota bacterium]MDE3193271.1 DNA recombination protein RmuC [Chloroflexota bacterium]
MIELIVAAALLFAGLAFVAAAIFVRGGRAHDGAAADERTSFELLQTQVAELARATTASVGELRGELQRSLSTSEERLGTQTGATQRALTDLAKQLAQLSERSERIGELAREVGSLHDLLRVPQPRGGFGELMLERLLADNLPAEAFELQHSFRDGSRVDAVVRSGGRIVPIDAKFPLESFQALLAAQTDDERRARRRAFLQQAKRHVDAVSRYVRPDEGTIDVAFLYMPAEQIFYSAFVIEEEGEDMRAYGAQRHVVPVSPNTLVAYLHLVALGLRGLAIEQRSREMHEQIRRAALELERFREMYDQLGRHVENASKKFTESLRALDKASSAVEMLGQTQLAAPAQSTLSLDLTERAPSDAKSRAALES